jgi:hypothetical protein
VESLVITRKHPNKEVVSWSIALLSEEGWLRDQKKLRSILSRADGVVSKHHQILSEFTHHPVRSITEASR